MELIRTISGIRGIVNKNFNESIASDYAKSFCSLQNKGPIILARDTRNRGLEILNKIAANITSLGRNVYDCGIIPTPVIQFLVTELNASGGIMITASHNPEEWNGMKFIDKDGCFINSEKNSNLLYNFDNNILPEPSTNKGKIVDKNHTKDLFINKLFDLKCLNIERIKNRQFEVVVHTRLPYRNVAQHVRMYESTHLHSFLNRKISICNLLNSRQSSMVSKQRGTSRNTRVMMSIKTTCHDEIRKLKC